MRRPQRRMSRRPWHRPQTRRRHPRARRARRLDRPLDRLGRPRPRLDRLHHDAAGPAHAAALGGRRVVGQPVGLDHAVGDVDPEAVDAAVEPEAQDAAELLAHLLVRPVEVGLRAVEEVQVPLAGRAVGLDDARPGRAAEDGLPVVRRLVAARAAAVAEEVAGALGAAGRGGERRLEPFVLVRRVVGHQVDDHADAAGVRLGEHRVEVGERAESRVDVAVVGDVVAGVALRRRVEGGEPDRVDPQFLQVAEPARDAGEVAHAVAVRIGERPGVDLVDRGGAPPLGSHDGNCTSSRYIMETLAAPARNAMITNRYQCWASGLVMNVMQGIPVIACTSAGTPHGRTAFRARCAVPASERGTQLPHQAKAPTPRTLRRAHQ